MVSSLDEERSSPVLNSSATRRERMPPGARQQNQARASATRCCCCCQIGCNRACGRCLARETSATRPAAEDDVARRTSPLESKKHDERTRVINLRNSCYFPRFISWPTRKTSVNVYRHAIDNDGFSTYRPSPRQIPPYYTYKALPPCLLLHHSRCCPLVSILSWAENRALYA